MYLAKVGRNTMTLVEFEAEKETAKLYYVKHGSEKSIVGSAYNRYVGLQLRKDDPSVFEHLPDAVQYLIAQGATRRQRMADDLAKLDSQIDELQKFMEHFYATQPDNKPE